ncbi:MAG: alkaline phosphatase family protein [Acholeplasmataceae bacterium]|nr:alkaline phosphatase family protein [Acholeplasmataceae bacterium]
MITVLSIKEDMILHPNYENSILNVTATILKSYHAPSIYPSIKELKKVLDKNPKHLILVLLDGMGVNIINRYLDKDDFLRKNIKKTITSVFPPTTVAATNAVLSGLPPFCSGYLGWVQYFKKEKTNQIVFLNQDFYDSSRKFDEILRDKYLSYPTIYEQIRMHSPNVNTYELFPNFRLNGFESFEKQVDQAIEISKNDERNFSYVYWTQPDFIQHDFGTESDEVKGILKSLNVQADRLAKEVDHDTVIIMIADHGLTNVVGIDLFDDQKMMRLLRRKPSMEPRATNFFVKALMKKKFKKTFNEKYGKEFQLYSKDELLDSRLLGYGIKHPLLDDFLGDFVAISIGNKMFNFKEHSRFLGHHAGLTKEEMEVPLIIFNKDKDNK